MIDELLELIDRWAIAHVAAALHWLLFSTIIVRNTVCACLLHIARRYQELNKVALSGCRCADAMLRNLYRWLAEGASALASPPLLATVRAAMRKVNQETFLKGH